MNKHCPESIEKDMLTLKRRVITQVNGVFHAYRLIKHMALGDVVVDFTEPTVYRPWYNKHRIRESDSKTREYLDCRQRLLSMIQRLGLSTGSTVEESFFLKW